MGCIYSDLTYGYCQLRWDADENVSYDDENCIDPENGACCVEDDPAPCNSCSDFHPNGVCQGYISLCDSCIDCDYREEYEDE